VFVGSVPALVAVQSSASVPPAVTEPGAGIWSATRSQFSGVTLNGAIDAGAAPVAIQANTDGAGAQGFTMAAASTITTTDAGPGAVAIDVNAGGGGTGGRARADHDRIGRTITAPEHRKHHGG
jgi:hypothetical protein